MMFSLSLTRESTASRPPAPKGSPPLPEQMAQTPPFRSVPVGVAKREGVIATCPSRQQHQWRFRGTQPGRSPRKQGAAVDCGDETVQKLTMRKSEKQKDQERTGGGNADADKANNGRSKAE